MGKKRYWFYQAAPRILGFLCLALGLAGALNGPIPYPPIPDSLIALHQDLAVELVGIGITVLVVDYAYEKSLEIEEKRKLTIQLGSRDNNLTKEAARVLRLRHWIDKGVLLGADLSDARLIDVDLRYADLREALLNRAELNQADLTGADLRKANFEDAELIEAILVEVDLRGAELADADFRRADFTGAKYTDEQFRNVESLEGTTMRDGKIYDPVVHTEIAEMRRAIGRDG